MIRSAEAVIRSSGGWAVRLLSKAALISPGRSMAAPCSDWRSSPLRPAYLGLSDVFPAGSQAQLHRTHAELDIVPLPTNASTHFLSVSYVSTVPQFYKYFHKFHATPQMPSCAVGHSISASSARISESPTWALVHQKQWHRPPHDRWIGGH